MSSLFGKPSAPVPQQVPINPADDSAAQQARDDAARAAIADSKARGRASTIVAGKAMVEEAQYGRGLLKSKQRAAVSNELGL
jgi:hypothetical protein